MSVDVYEPSNELWPRDRFDQIGPQTTEKLLICVVLKSPKQPGWGLWYFSVWNFKTRHTKLDSPLGKNLWNLNYLFQYCTIKESRGSEVVKSRSL